MSVGEETRKAWLEERGLDRLAELKPTPDDSKAAWPLFIELRTRISTRKLHFRSGTEQAALASLHKLFTLTRDAISTAGPGCQHFSVAAILLLNHTLSPFTSKWHRLLEAGAFASDDARREFRGELQKLREDLLAYLTYFCALAMGDGYFEGAERISLDEGQGSGGVDTGGEIMFTEILFPHWTGDRKLETLKAQIWSDERGSVNARRGQPQDADVKDLIGIACSGGGIRSASFCLGVFQGLAKPRFGTPPQPGKPDTRGNVLQSADYLSTVSGGGYLGAFVSSYLNQNATNVGLVPGEDPFDHSAMPEPKPLRSIRNGTKYLLEGGLFGRARALGLFAVGMLINVLCLVPLAAGALVLAQLGAGSALQWVGLSAEQAFLYVAAGLVALALLSPIGWAFFDTSGFRQIINKVGIFVAVVFAAAGGFYAAVLAFNHTMNAASSSELLVVAGAAALPLALAIAAVICGAASLAGRILLTLFGLTGPIFALVSVIALAKLLDRTAHMLHGCVGAWLGTGVGPTWLWVAVLAALAIAVPRLYGFLFNVNLITPFRYYRDRLAGAFLLKKDGVQQRQPLADMGGENPHVPYHLINAAVNIPKSTHRELRGRDSDFFLFSRHYCGSPIVGYCKTGDYETADPQLHLATAMAISGAAVSPYMGTLPFGRYRFWLALFNIRLGYWVHNPAHVEAGTVYGWPGLSCIFREFTGWLTDNARFVNISDGGHIDNTGLYELLRRRCKYIVAIDGEADATVTCSGLYKVIRHAEIDFKIKIDIDTYDVALRASRNSGAHFTVGRIHYHDGAIAILVYVKLSVTGNEPGYLADYRRTNPDFPFESTADQFFDEAQFEAYRALGEHAAEDLFGPEVAGETPPATISAWFKALAVSHLANV